MLSNAYFLAKFRFDTAENEPAKNLQNFANFVSLLTLTPNPYASPSAGGLVSDQGLPPQNPIRWLFFLTKPSFGATIGNGFCTRGTTTLHPYLSYCRGRK